MGRVWINWRRVSAAFLLLLAIWIVSWLAARSLIVTAPLSHADAIVVLSGSATLKERAAHAARLYREAKATKVVLTNDNQQGSWSQAEQRNPYFYESAIAVLVNNGVPREAIEVIPTPVTGTYDESLVIERYCSERRLKTLLVVTSAYHSRRALWTMQRVFRDSLQLGLDPVPTGIQTPNPGTWWLHVRGWAIVPTEHIKMGWYWLRY